MIGWDKEFAFLVWLVRVDERQLPAPAPWQSSSRDFLSRVGPVEDAASALPASDRFLQLAPGQSVSKDFVLTSSFRCFEFGFKSDRYHVVAVPTEGMYRYQFPQNARRVEIQVVTPTWEGPGYSGFRPRFGVGPAEVNPMDFRSNTLTIEFTD